VLVLPAILKPSLNKHKKQSKHMLPVYRLLYCLPTFTFQYENSGCSTPSRFPRKDGSGWRIVRADVREPDRERVGNHWDSGILTWDLCCLRRNCEKIVPYMRTHTYEHVPSATRVAAPCRGETQAASLGQWQRFFSCCNPRHQLRSAVTLQFHSDLPSQKPKRHLHVIIMNAGP